MSYANDLHDAIHEGSGHTHTFDVGGKKVTTSSDSGKTHNHSIEVGGKRMWVGGAKDGPSHVHYAKINGKTVKSSTPN